MNTKLESIGLPRALAKIGSMGRHATAVVAITAPEGTKRFQSMLKTTNMLRQINGAKNRFGRIANA